MKTIEKLQQSNQSTTNLGIRLPCSLLKKLDDFCSKNKISKAAFVIEGINKMFEIIESEK